MEDNATQDDEISAMGGSTALRNDEEYDLVRDRVGREGQQEESRTS